MRCRLGRKKIRKLERILGVKITHALTRGNTNHRIDIFLEGGKEAFGEIQLYHLKGKYYDEEGREIS